VREEASIVSPSQQPMVIAALGGSAATPGDGLEAEVVRFGGLRELEAASRASIEGRIVFSYPRAVESYERALAVDPTSWRHAADLAQILTFVPGGRPRAVQVIQAALGYHPDEPELLRVLQVVHQRP
jgi:hypothetical protein